MKKIRLIHAAIIAMAISLPSAKAQPQWPQGPGEGPGMRSEFKMRTPEERAEQKTDMMDKAANLDKKQYKKIYSIFLKEEKAKEQAMMGFFQGGNFPGGMPGGPGMGGGFPGGGFPGGGPGMGGGFPGGGPGMGGGFPGGGPGMGRPEGGRPEGMTFPGMENMPKPKVGGKEIDSDEYIYEREKKFMKILTPEQYAAWRRFQPNPKKGFGRSF